MQIINEVIANRKYIADVPSGQKRTEKKNKMKCLRPDTYTLDTQLLFKFHEKERKKKKKTQNHTNNKKTKANQLQFVETHEKKLRKKKKKKPEKIDNR